MRITTIAFDENSFGITQRSLKVLRNTLAQKAHHHIAVVEVPTNDLCCGYLILDKDSRTATFTGDGFRMDRGGEGGAGYRSAEALFGLFGLKPIPWDMVNIDEIYQGETEIIRQKLLRLAQEIAETLIDSDYIKPLDRNPQYLRS